MSIVKMFNIKRSDDSFSEAGFYTLRDPKAIIVLDGKEYKNDYSDVIAFTKQVLNKDYQDLTFKIKMPNGKAYNVKLIHIEPIYIGFYDEVYVELVEMETLILDGKHNKYVCITNRIYFCP